MINLLLIGKYNSLYFPIENGKGGRSAFNYKRIRNPILDVYDLHKDTVVVRNFCLAVVSFLSGISYCFNGMNVVREYFCGNTFKTILFSTSKYIQLKDDIVIDAF